MPAPAPDLAPAVAEHRDPPRDALRTAVLATLVVLVFSVLRDDDGGLLPDPGALVIALLGGGLLGLMALRSRTSAGPGWLVRRRVAGSSWVRTDQLVEVRAGRSITDVNLRLRDRDGRSLFIPWSAVAVSPKLAARVRQDVHTSVATGADLDARSAEILLGRRR
jgi:hypothetical protein